MKDIENIKEDREYKYDFKDDVESIFSTGKGLNEEVVRAISKAKNEPSWMLEYRLNALKMFQLQMQLIKTS